MNLNAFFLFCMATITAIGLTLWWRIWRSCPEKRDEYLYRDPPSPVGMLDFFVAAAVWMTAPSVGIAALPFNATDFAALGAMEKNVMQAVIATAQLLGCGFLLAYLGIVRYGSLSWLFNVQPAWGQQVILTAKAFCMVFPVTLAIQALLSKLVPYKHETLSMLNENFSFWTILATWYGAVLAAPLCEELVFRGVLQSWLHRVHAGKSAEDKMSEIIGGWPQPKGDIRRSEESVSLAWLRFRWWFPILLSSAMFAAIHLGQGAAPIPLFVFSVGLGFLFRYSGSLVPCIMLHLMLNAFTMFWMTLQLIFGNTNGTV